MQSQIPRVVFGALDEKAGAAGSIWDLLRDPRTLHKVEVMSGVMEIEILKVLNAFFSRIRE